MKNFKSMKDLPVYSKHTGEILGNVSDLCFDDKGTIQGILMDTKGFLKRDRIIPIDAVSSFGNDGIMVGNVKAIYAKNDTARPVHMLQHHNGLIGKSIITSEGEKLGLVDDVYFMEEMGTIVGYEVTEGFFADITEGKKVVKTNSPLTNSKDTVIITIS